jgi:hypothetical protein
MGLVRIAGNASQRHDRITYTAEMFFSGFFLLVGSNKIMKNFNFTRKII